MEQSLSDPIVSRSGDMERTFDHQQSKNKNNNVIGVSPPHLTCSQSGNQVDLCEHSAVFKSSLNTSGFIEISSASSPSPSSPLSH